MSLETNKQRSKQAVSQLHFVIITIPCVNITILLIRTLRLRNFKLFESNHITHNRQLFLVHCYLSPHPLHQPITHFYLLSFAVFVVERLKP